MNELIVISNTLEILQSKLCCLPQVVNGFTRKKLNPQIICKDGTTLSVQASEGHYSCPQDDFGPYSEVEVWCITPGVIVCEFDYSDEVPSGYVPIEQVAKFIDNHGGFVET